ncbi:39S ribosomal protein L48, mitochondrial isoform X1 [Brienomyrus brachyistius]|uniref:39S ribosomal protein L48, mitochondrial isoform X1 n=2 Tax=Brienomyrus brachyistius TaxID=42636 RepID=UPI0020B29F25|nr:39S ribosomal protein L48, mitochondrial isoform X1 [Brienomyrus brachyistius]XP_048839249.1 39S ribosomal protein L48, mitochondrial isoform X1 [Brienomyrus brachyistius]
MNHLFTKLLVSFTQQTCRKGFLFGAVVSKQHPLLGSLLPSDGREYKSMPTHGIGRYSHLIPGNTFTPWKVKKRRKKSLKMKPIDEGTETEYGLLNLTISGYDMNLVSRYAQYAHHLCNRLQVHVSRSYALPTKTTEILLTKDQSTKMVVDAVLKTHFRVIQIKGLSATICPVFFEVLLKNQPEGVDLLVKEHTEADFRARFKSRPEMEELLAKLNG